MLTAAGCGGPRQVEDMEYALSYLDREVAGTYTGAVVSGLPSGQGSFSSADGEPRLEYFGEWLEGAFSGDGELVCGFYTVSFLDGIDRVGKFEGQVTNGAASGSGSFAAVNDSGESYVYTGQWKDGLFEGQGVTKYDNKEYYVQAGSYRQGEYEPTPAQFFAAVGSGESGHYELSDNAFAFIDARPQVFTDRSTDGLEESLTDSEFKYEQFSKNPARYGDKLAVASGLTVVQISEETYWGAEHCFIIALDGSYNCYYINMYGFAEDIYEGDRITLTMLPLDYFTYKTTSGSENWAIACAGVSVSKG